MGSAEHLRMVGLLDAMRVLMSERERDAIIPTLMRTMQTLLPELGLRFVPVPPELAGAPGISDDAEAGAWLNALLRLPPSEAAHAPPVLMPGRSLHAVADARQLQGAIVATHRNTTGPPPLEVLDGLLRIYRA